MDSEHTPCIIIGAGPAGLSLGYHLKRLGIEFIIVDQATIGQSWQSMPDKLRLLSPFWTNRLPGHLPALPRLFSKTGKHEFMRYLLAFAERENLPVREFTKVLQLFRRDRLIHIETNKGNFTADTAVCASGYFHNPYIPNPPGGNDHTIPTMHACEYKNASDILNTHPECRSVLIIGKRVTAGQLITELHEAGLQIMLSARSEVTTRGFGLGHSLKEHIYFFYESVKIRLDQRLHLDSYPEMDGGETTRLLASGEVPVFGNLESIRNGEAFIEGDNTIRPDLIIYATGYRPSLEYVSELELEEPSGNPATRNMQSTSMPGVYFIGFDNIVNFRSRYLRGIRNDSRQLAKTLYQALTPS